MNWSGCLSAVIMNGTDRSYTRRVHRRGIERRKFSSTTMSSSVKVCNSRVVRRDTSKWVGMAANIPLI